MWNDFGEENADEKCILWVFRLVKPHSPWKKHDCISGSCYGPVTSQAARSTHQSLKSRLEHRSFLFRKDAKHQESLQSFLVIPWGFSLQLVWLRNNWLLKGLKCHRFGSDLFFFPPEAVQGPDCTESLSLSGGVRAPWVPYAHFCSSESRVL